MTAKAGTGRPQADQTGEPEAPDRSQTRQPRAEAARAKTEASAKEPNGTNKQAGAGDQPAPPGRERRAHAQPQAKGRATMPAPREKPGTETKPAINTPKTERREQNLSRHQPDAGAAEGPPGAAHRDGREPLAAAPGGRGGGRKNTPPAVSTDARAAHAFCAGAANPCIRAQRRAKYFAAEPPLGVITEQDA
ncbi:MAG: hypothetical protein ACXW0G_00220 [Methylosarcina sp.]